MRTARLLTCLALAALGAGCAPRFEVHRRGGPPIRARAIAVYPYLFRWDEPAHRSHEKAMDAVLALAGRRRLLVFAPGEFRCFDPGESRVLLGSDLAQVMAARGLPQREFLVLRGWAERRVARSVDQVAGGGTLRTRVEEESVYLGHVEILDPDSTEPVVEVSGRAERRTGATPPDHDPAPELTDLHRRLVAAAFEALEGRLEPAPPLPALPVDARWLPAATLEFALPGRPSVKESAALDRALGEAARWEVYRYRDPGAPERRLAEEMRLPGGLLVTRTDGSGPLAPGDVVVSAGGEAVVGPHVVQRALALAGGRPVPLVVARGEERVEILVRSP